MKILSALVLALALIFLGNGVSACSTQCDTLCESFFDELCCSESAGGVCVCCGGRSQRLRKLQKSIPPTNHTSSGGRLLQRRGCASECTAPGTFCCTTLDPPVCTGRCPW